MRLVEEEFQRAEAEGSEELEGYGIKFDKENKRYYSDEASMSLQCQTKRFVSKNTLNLFVFVVLIHMCYQSYKKYQEKRKEKQFAYRIYSEIFIDLHRSKKRCLRELYKQAEDRHGKESVEDFWPEVEQLRLKFGKIGMTKEEVDGESELFWMI